MTRPKNVLFILIDQMRADLLDGALAAHIDLPNLRALQDEATSFARHYSVVNPCGPSRCSILTGQYAMNHRAVRNGTPLRHDTPNIALEARKAGYRPLLFGYTDVTRDPRIHHPADPAVRSYEQPLPGFDEVVEMRLEESYPWRAYLAAKGYDLPDYARFYEPQAAPGQPRALADPAFYRAEDSDTAFLTDRCLDHLGARRGERWFAHLTYIRPHPPLVAPAPYNRMYDPATLPAPRRAQEDGPGHPFADLARRLLHAGRTVDGFQDVGPDDATARTLRAVYFGLATEVDHHIGRVIAWLKQNGLYDETLLVVGADHGEMLGDFGCWGKATFHEAAYHVPLIIRDPTLPAGHGRRVAAFTEAVDVMPTILDRIGVPVPASVNGCALTPFLRGESPADWRRYSYSELDFGDPVTATPWQRELGLDLRAANLAILRDDRHMLVHFAGGLPPLLFDRTGAGETQDLAGDPERAGDLLAMTQALLGHRMRFADTTLSTMAITAEGPVAGG